jgi:hypothetical protein
MAEEGVSVVGSEALVEEVHGEGGVDGANRFHESIGEGQSLEGLGAGGAVGVKGIADEEDFYFVLADEAGDGFEVGAEIGAVEGEEGLRGEAEGVGDGEADALVADVERENAGCRHGISVSRVSGARV